jgi:hypothetical protein
MQENENNFHDLNKIVSVVSYPTPSLVVKHCVVLKRKVIPKNQYQKEEERGYDFFYNYNGVTGLYLEARGQIVFEGHRNAPLGEGAKPRKIIALIEIKDISSLLNRIDIVYNWLTGEENRKIYLSDSQGKPCKIADPDRKVAVSLTQSAYLAFRPCIIRDINSMTYEGVVMLTEEGEITNFTASEYSSFRITMHGLLPNLYMANTMLINNALQLCIYNKLSQ